MILKCQPFDEQVEKDEQVGNRFLATFQTK